jgi:hypothetical protein
VVLAERWIRYGAAAFVAGACVRFTSPDASPLPAFLAAAYGAMLPRLAEAGAAGERDRERWATNLPSDLVVVGAGLSPFAFWLLRGLVRYPAGSWEHLIAQAAFQLATVTSAVALASWVSLRWPTPLHWHHHAALPWVFLAVTLELGGGSTPSPRGRWLGGPCTSRWTPSGPRASCAQADGRRQGYTRALCAPPSPFWACSPRAVYGSSACVGPQNG